MLAWGVSRPRSPLALQGVLPGGACHAPGFAGCPAGILSRAYHAPAGLRRGALFVPWAAVISAAGGEVRPGTRALPGQLEGTALGEETLNETASGRITPREGSPPRRPMSATVGAHGCDLAGARRSRQSESSPASLVLRIAERLGKGVASQFAGIPTELSGGLLRLCLESGWYPESQTDLGLMVFVRGHRAAYCQGSSGKEQAGRITPRSALSAGARGQQAEMGFVWGTRKTQVLPRRRGCANQAA